MNVDPPARRVSSDQLTPTVSYAYAPLLEANARLVVRAGACSLDDAGRTVAVGDVTGQADQAMVNLRVALQAAGADLAEGVKITAYVAATVAADLIAASQVVHRHLGEHEPPSTLLGVTVLGYPDQLVEVEAVAAMGTGSPVPPTGKPSGGSVG